MYLRETVEVYLEAICVLYKSENFISRSVHKYLRTDGTGLQCSRMQGKHLHDIYKSLKTGFLM